MVSIVGGTIGPNDVPATSGAAPCVRFLGLKKIYSKVLRGFGRSPMVHLGPKCRTIFSNISIKPYYHRLREGEK